VEGGFGLGLDRMRNIFQICNVRQGESTHDSKCKHDLDSKLQRRFALLNTSRHAFTACCAVSLRIAPSRSNDCAGDISIPRRAGSIPGTVKARWQASPASNATTTGRFLQIAVTRCKDRLMPEAETPTATHQIVRAGFSPSCASQAASVWGDLGGFAVPSPSPSLAVW